jgi:hypothetical protein
MSDQPSIPFPWEQDFLGRIPFLKSRGTPQNVPKHARRKETFASERRGTASTHLKNRCKQQNAQCTRFFAEACQAAPVPSACEALAGSCCADLGRCDPAAFLICVIASSG